MSNKIISPYANLPVKQWWEKTKELISQHPLKTEELVEITLKSWNELFFSSIGSKPFRIGVEIFPKPQIMGFLLHEIIPLELSERYRGIWCNEKTVGGKDIVYIPDDRYSIEIKTSSSKGKIFGNRSYAQKPRTSKKSKSGYYLAINFQKFSQEVTRPEITRIRFGWIDHEDWLGQKAASGQQSRLDINVEKFKLLEIYRFE